MPEREEARKIVNKWTSETLDDFTMECIAGARLEDLLERINAALEAARQPECPSCIAWSEEAASLQRDLAQAREEIAASHTLVRIHDACRESAEKECDHLRAALAELRRAVSEIPQDWLPAGHDETCGCQMCGTAKAIAKDINRVLARTEGQESRDE